MPRIYSINTNFLFRLPPEPEDKQRERQSRPVERQLREREQPIQAARPLLRHHRDEAGEVEQRGHPRQPRQPGRHGQAAAGQVRLQPVREGAQDEHERDQAPGRQDLHLAAAHPLLTEVRGHLRLHAARRPGQPAPESAHLAGAQVPADIHVAAAAPLSGALREQ